MSNSSSTSRSEQDCQSQNKTNPIAVTLTSDLSPSKGFYDAEKCRAHIANQIKVSKIDRFAAQINKAQEIEIEIHARIRDVLGLFVSQWAKPTQEFASRCKLGFQNRYCNMIAQYSGKKQRPNLKKKKFKSKNPSLISDELLEGSQLRMMIDLLTNSSNMANYGSTDPMNIEDDYIGSQSAICEQDCSRVISKFKPKYLVDRLKDHLKNDRRRSRRLVDNLCSLKQYFEKLATEHRLNVDLVYAAEEERQSATVIRRSAYNLSLAAIKATTTPVHVSSNNDHSII